jgi:hypothetical protein
MEVSPVGLMQCAQKARRRRPSTIILGPAMFCRAEAAAQSTKPGRWEKNLGY